MTPEHIRTIAVLLVASLAAAFDVRTRRIPNVLNFGGALAALVFAFMNAGLQGTLTVAAAWLLGVAVFFPVFALRGMGAGDVKLMAALAAWLGPMDTLYLAFFSSLAGGIAAVLVATARGYARQALSNIWLMLMHWRVAGPQPVSGFTLQDGQAPRLAYAIPIAVGAVFTLWRH
jgi:prepilin peptidase CpaA